MCDTPKGTLSGTRNKACPAEEFSEGKCSTGLNSGGKEIQDAGKEIKQRKKREGGKSSCLSLWPEFTLPI